MPAEFEMQPSTYHLGWCTTIVGTDANGEPVRCGQPAVERWVAGPASELAGDERRCEQHVERQAERH